MNKRLIKTKRISFNNLVYLRVMINWFQSLKFQKIFGKRLKNFKKIMNFLRLNNGFKKDKKSIINIKRRFNRCFRCLKKKKPRIINIEQCIVCNGNEFLPLSTILVLKHSLMTIIQRLKSLFKQINKVRINLKLTRTLLILYAKLKGNFKILFRRVKSKKILT